MFHPENIPQELKDRPQWVVWRYEDRAGGEATKVPYDPCAGGLRRASSTDRSTWGSFLEAMNKRAAGRFDGLGFVFTAEDPYVGVDLDDCYDESRSPTPDFRLDPDERGWVQDLSSYTEVSPSNTGVKVIFRGKLPEDLDRHSWGGNGIYEEGRFFTVTGNVLGGRKHITAVAPDTLNSLLHRWFPPTQAHEWEDTEERFTDVEVLRMIRCAANADKFTDLWNGAWEDWYPSHSDADLGLVSVLAFYTGPCSRQLDRLFRQSGLMRPKWDERRGPGSYGQRTIDRALSLTEEYYTMTTRGTTAQDEDEPVYLVGVDKEGNTIRQGPITEVRAAELYPVAMHQDTGVDPYQTLVLGNDSFGSAVAHRRERKAWQKGLEGFSALGPEDRPLYLRLVHEHVAPLAVRLGDDWVDLMALSFLSAFFNNVTIERLPLNLWVLGISAQGVGKSVTSDELELVTKETAGLLACNLASFTGGSNAGLVRLLSRDRRQKVLTYASEWTSLIKLMDSEHSGSLREALLNYYDGRGYTHVLANEVLVVEDPYLVVNGLTTKANWTRHTDFADTGNGLYSRFLFACPDVLPAGDEYPYRTRAQRSAVTGQLYAHLANLPSVELAVLESRQSPAYREYAHYLGMDNHSGAIDMDEVGLSVDDDDAQPGGRRLAQVKKVGAVLELLEERPQVRNGVFRVREANVQRAVRLVQRGSAYARRAYGWLARSKDEEQALVVRHTLEKRGPLSEFELVQATGLGIIAARAALELLTNEGLVDSRVADQRRVYSVRGARA